jgi:hypothetical protein
MFLCGFDLAVSIMTGERPDSTTHDCDSSFAHRILLFVAVFSIASKRRVSSGRGKWAAIFLMRPARSPNFYSQKFEAVSALGLQLLRLRDGKTRGLKSTGVLVALGNELVKAAKQEGGYPDSDDSDSDDEETGTSAAVKPKTALNPPNKQRTGSVNSNGGANSPRRKTGSKRPSVVRTHMDIFMCDTLAEIVNFCCLMTAYVSANLKPKAPA